MPHNLYSKIQYKYKYTIIYDKREVITPKQAETLQEICQSEKLHFTFEIFLICFNISTFLSSTFPSSYENSTIPTTNLLRGGSFGATARPAERHALGGTRRIAPVAGTRRNHPRGLALLVAENCAREANINAAVRGAIFGDLSRSECNLGGCRTRRLIMRRQCSREAGTGGVFGRVRGDEAAVEGAGRGRVLLLHKNLVLFEKSIFSLQLRFFSYIEDV